MKRLAPLGVLAACLASAACYSWVAPTQSFTRPVIADSAVVVRITTTGGDRYELESPRIVDDTIVAGWRNIGDRRDPRFDRPRIALDDVARFEVRGVAVIRTVGFFAFLGGAFFVTGKYGLPAVFQRGEFDSNAPPPPPPPCVVTVTCR